MSTGQRSGLLAGVLLSTVGALFGLLPFAGIAEHPCQGPLAAVGPPDSFCISGQRAREPFAYGLIGAGLVVGLAGYQIFGEE